MSVNSNEVKNQIDKVEYEIDDSYLIDSYISKNVDKFKDDNVSFHVFLFGVPYLFYRKMWLLGFIILIIENIINITPYAIVYPYFHFLMQVVISIEFKKIYLKHVKKQVNKIKEKNLDKSMEELTNICKEKGGTSIISVVVLGIILFIVKLAPLFLYYIYKFFFRIFKYKKI